MDGVTRYQSLAIGQLPVSLHLRLLVLVAIGAAPLGWLAGYVPGLEAWFRGAETFVPVLVWCWAPWLIWIALVYNYPTVWALSSDQLTLHTKSRLSWPLLRFAATMTIALTDVQQVRLETEGWFAGDAPKQITLRTRSGRKFSLPKRSADDSFDAFYRNLAQQVAWTVPAAAVQLTTDKVVHTTWQKPWVRAFSLLMLGIGLLALFVRLSHFDGFHAKDARVLWLLLLGGYGCWKSFLDKSGGGDA